MSKRVKVLTGMFCKDCKYWQKPVDQDYGACRRFGPPEVTLTNRIKSDDAALVYPGGARLLTRAGFGCNQYERQLEPRL